MDKVTFIVLFNMTVALIGAGFVTWLFHTGRWPKSSQPKESQTASPTEKRDAR